MIDADWLMAADSNLSANSKPASFQLALSALPAGATSTLRGQTLRWTSLQTSCR